jgi:hypothetical protein
MPLGGEKGRPIAEPGSVTFMYHSSSLPNKLFVTAEGERPWIVRLKRSRYACA